MPKEQDRTNELLDLLTLSAKRRRLLLLLREGPKTLGDINSSLKTISSGMLPQIRKLERANLISQTDKEFSLTETGDLVAKSLSRFLKTLEVIEKHDEFWKNHRISGIPEPFRIRFHELWRCKIVESSPTEIFLPHREFMRNLSRSSRIKGVSPIFHPEYPPTFLGLAKKGAEVSLIVTRPVFEKIKAEHGDALKNFLNQGNTEFMICDEEIGVAFTVTDIFLSLGLFHKNGTYDTHRDLISFEESAIKWGEDLFNYYKKRSEKIDRYS